MLGLEFFVILHHGLCHPHEIPFLAIRLGESQTKNQHISWECEYYILDRYNKGLVLLLQEELQLKNATENGWKTKKKQKWT